MMKRTITKKNQHGLLRIMTLTGCTLLSLGIISIVIKATSTEYIDQQGFLHENFFLLPIGFSLIFAGGGILLMLAVIRFLRNKKQIN